MRMRSFINLNEKESEINAIKSNKELKLRVGARLCGPTSQEHGPSFGRNLKVKMLTEVQATENVLEAARKYVCRSCYHRAKPFQVPLSGGISSTTFGNRLVVDSSWIQLGPDRQCILTMVDEATRYLTVRILASEKSTNFLKGIERSDTLGFPSIFVWIQPKDGSPKLYVIGVLITE